MSELAYSIGGFLVALGILVTVHEFGHYWVARRLGVKVLKFSIGFGKTLWSWRAGKDGTEYVLALIPLGGYVKMLDENEGEVAPAEAHRAFNRQSLMRRSLIVLAGPAFNFLFAILAYWLVFMSGIESIKPVVGKVAAGSIAERAGFQAGDEFLTLDGRPVQSWDEHRLYLFNQALARASVRVTVREAAGPVRERELNLGALSLADLDAGLLEKGLGLQPYFPEVPPVVGYVDERSPAGRAGVQIGDRVVAIDGTPVSTWTALVQYVSARAGQPLRLVLDRAGQQLAVELVVESVTRGEKTAGRIGIGAKLPEYPPEMRVTVRYTPLVALGRGVENTWVMSALTLKMLAKMLRLEVSVKNISGPITIAQYAGHSARIGVDQFVLFLAIVSISLGVLNLLPVPVLDGGHLLYHLGEAVYGGPLPKQVMLVGQQIGILLLLALMGLAFYNDLARLLQ